MRHSSQFRPIFELAHKSERRVSRMIVRPWFWHAHEVSVIFIHSVKCPMRVGAKNLGGTDELVVPPYEIDRAAHIAVDQSFSIED